jgi:hypothetical protein
MLRLLLIPPLLRESVEGGGREGGCDGVDVEWKDGGGDRSGIDDADEIMEEDTREVERSDNEAR